MWKLLGGFTWDGSFWLVMCLDLFWLLWIHSEVRGLVFFRILPFSQNSSDVFGHFLGRFSSHSLISYSFLIMMTWLSQWIPKPIWNHTSVDSKETFEKQVKYQEAILTYFKTINPSSLVVIASCLWGPKTIPGWSVNWGMTSSPKDKPRKAWRVNTIRSFILRSAQQICSASDHTRGDGGNDRRDEKHLAF